MPRIDMGPYIWLARQTEQQQSRECHLDHLEPGTSLSELAYGLAYHVTHKNTQKEHRILLCSSTPLFIKFTKNFSQCSQWAKPRCQSNGTQISCREEVATTYRISGDAVRSSELPKSCQGDARRENSC